MIEASYVDIGGVLAYVEQQGSGPEVLCLHTAGQSGVQWRRVIGPLAELGYRVVVPDLPGHGRSEPATGGPVDDLGEYAAWCAELVERLGLRRPYVVGCSIGGKIALDLAVRMGDRLAGVVAMAAEPGPGRVNLRGLRRELEDAAAPSRTDRTYLGTLAVVGRSIPPERAELIATMHRREDPAVSTSDLIGWGSHDVRSGLADVRCPAYLVAGADDLWIDSDAVREAADAMPQGRYARIEGVGHYPMQEMADFPDAVHTWLTELTPTPSGTSVPTRHPATAPQQGATRPVTTHDPTNAHHPAIRDLGAEVPHRALLPLLRDLATRDPQAVAAIDTHPERPVVVCRAELLRRTLALRAQLESLGLSRGDCVAVWLPNWSDALCWQIATASLGAHVIGVNTRYNVDEVAHVLQRAQPRVIAIAHDFHGLDLVGTLHAAAARAQDATPSVAVVPGPHGSAPNDIAAYDLGANAWLPRHTPDVQMSTSAPLQVRMSTSAPQEGDELAVAFTTSGSTGVPKLAAHNESAVVGHAIADAEGMGITDEDVVLCALPVSGVFGFNTAMAAFAGGAACLFEPVFDAATVLDDMRRWGVTHVVGADDLLGRLADQWQHTRQDLSSWRWLGIADFLGRSHELAAWVGREFGTFTTGVYGSSEAFALTTFWPPEVPEPRRLDGGGYLVSPRCRAKIVDPVTERELPAGEQGELRLRGPNVVDAYLGDSEAARRSFTADGWFRTGDLAEMAADGGITYVCRMGDVLRLRGFLVDPAEIEQRLGEHDDVDVAKVVGVRGHDGGDQAVGFVVARAGSGVNEATLREWCAATLAKFKVPSAIHLIEEMPTTSGTNGTKIKAATLREWAQRDLAESER